MDRGLPDAEVAGRVGLGVAGVEVGTEGVGIEFGSRHERLFSCFTQKQTEVNSFTLVRFDRGRHPPRAAKCNEPEVSRARRVLMKLISGQADSSRRCPLRWRNPHLG